MKQYYKELDKAISRLRVDCEKLKELLAEGVAYKADITDEISDIREEAFDLIDACDITEEDFDFIDLPE